ncbi:MAG: pectate lyase, partial [Candidatus Omnitrophica bacterium]|nr:pectate lyase [Candidatus Omnitrophota bacterium]
YELPSITAQESVDVVRFLQRIPSPSPEIRESIESALKWFRSSAITGYRLERVPIEPVRFENHTATQDVVLVEDPSAPPLWARFYDLKTGKPIFCNRDGKVVGSLSEVALERRTGYAWYGSWPSKLLQ